MTNHSTLRPVMTMVELQNELANVRVWSIGHEHNHQHHNNRLDRSDWDNATLVDINDDGKVVDKHDWMWNLFLALMLFAMIFLFAFLAENSDKKKNHGHTVSISKEVKSTTQQE